MDTCLVGESTVATKKLHVSIVARSANKVNWGTNVMGFMKGTLTSTASATRFSISRSIFKLYLDLTYSGSAA